MLRLQAGCPREKLLPSRPDAAVSLSLFMHFALVVDEADRIRCRRDLARCVALHTAQGMAPDAAYDLMAFTTGDTLGGVRVASHLVLDC